MLSPVGLLDELFIAFSIPSFIHAFVIAFPSLKTVASSLSPFVYFCCMLHSALFFCLPLRGWRLVATSIADTRLPQRPTSIDCRSRCADPGHGCVATWIMCIIDLLGKWISYSCACFKRVRVNDAPSSPVRPTSLQTQGN